MASWAADVRLCREAGWSVDLPYERHLAFWRDVIEGAPAELVRLVL